MSTTQGTPGLHAGPYDEKCPVHYEPWLIGSHQGRRRCTFYVPELGASEDYGCPQDERLVPEGLR